jgi:hypothetical protein
MPGGARPRVQPIAEHATLCRASGQRHRPHEDLSHGWGSHARWGTCCRRADVQGTDFSFNGDGRLDAALPTTTTRRTPRREDLELGERSELLARRCLMRTRTPHKPANGSG